MKSFLFLFSFIAFLFSEGIDLYQPVNIQKAYSNQTRSEDGQPGKNYWQNSANYRINAEINPISGLLTGNESIEYFNNSPDTLHELYIHLFMNIYKKGNPREYVVDPADENMGVIIESFSVNGKEVNDGAMEYIHNDFILHLDHPLSPGKTLNLSADWHFTINKNSHFRTGRVDSTSWFVAYFFPRVAVYDDIDGWNNFKYSGSAEFYNDFGDFDIQITVPRNFVVWATGVLQNPDEVLRKKFADKLSKALFSDQIIHIIDSSECSSGEVTTSDTKNTWHYKANYISDFAFGVSDHYLWDASGLLVDKLSNRRVLIDAAYDKHSKDFYSVAQIARDAIDYMSNKIPGVPFPYPNETVFNGLDEMEYPMMVNNISVKDTVYLVKVTSHEIFHSYFPFYMGTNESKYAWMDEGFASFGDFLIVSELVSPDAADYYYLESYRTDAGHEVDVPIITDSKYLTRPMYHYNAYAKPAAFLYALKDLLGIELFTRTLQEYMRRWNGKHPTPYDFFYTFNDASGQDLNWLFKPWFFEFGYVDLGIKDIVYKKGKADIIVDKIGRYPAPVKLEIQYEDGSVLQFNETASVWKEGKQTVSISVPGEVEIKKVELKSRLVPDADVSNNVFVP